jgi:AraC-like ligand binding domain
LPRANPRGVIIFLPWDRPVYGRNDQSVVQNACAEKGGFFAYLTAEPHENWGVELATVGHQHAAPRSKYPPPGHPRTHAFEWKDGRELNEYHLVYVISGAGSFETRRRRVEVAAGDLILIYKSDWHRYRPHDETGWEAYWVGFKGRYIERYVAGKVFMALPTGFEPVLQP